LPFQEIPIKTVHLIPIIDQQLISLLQSLTEQEWQLPAIAKQWTVKDIAAHLLDGNIRGLSFSRDHHQPETNNNIQSYQDLVNYLNSLNADWVKAMKRLSPALLVELLTATGKTYIEHLASLDPFDKAIFPVAWAGEAESYNWFHIAREYTEKFIHQLQIREAVNTPGLMDRELFYPFIETLMYALPHTYRNINAEKDTTIRVTIETESGGDWFLVKADTGWLLSKQCSNHIHATISLPPRTAWKLFSKGISAAEARQYATISGDEELATVALNTISIMG
jgi:hypothetical protein